MQAKSASSRVRVLPGGGQREGSPTATREDRRCAPGLAAAASPARRPGSAPPVRRARAVPTGRRRGLPGAGRPRASVRAATRVATVLPTSVGSRSKRVRLPRSAYGEPACANSQSSTPQTCRRLEVDEQVLGVEVAVHQHRAGERLCRRAVADVARQVDEPRQRVEVVVAPGGDPAVVPLVAGRTRPGRRGPRGWTRPDPRRRTCRSRRTEPLTTGPASPPTTTPSAVGSSVSWWSRRAWSSGVPSSRLVTRTAGSSADAGLTSSTDATGSTPRSRRSSPASTTARSGARR